MASASDSIAARVELGPTTRDVTSLLLVVAAGGVGLAWLVDPESRIGSLAELLG